MSGEYDDEDAFLANMKRNASWRQAVATWATAAAISVGIIAFVALVAGAKPDPATALRAVDEAGFTQAEVVESGVDMYRCARSDAVYYRVRAANSKGDKVVVTVCCGIYKDCTVRY